MRGFDYKRCQRGFLRRMELERSKGHPQGSACPVSPIFHFCHWIYTWDKPPGGCARPGCPAKRSSLRASPNSLLQPWRGAGDRDRTWTQHFQPGWQQQQHPDGTGRMRPAVPSSVPPAAPTRSGCPFSQPGRRKPPHPQLSAARGLPKAEMFHKPSKPSKTTPRPFLEPICPFGHPTATNPSVFGKCQALSSSSYGVRLF